MLQPFKCPVCNGYGTVSKPPWIAGDINGWCAGNTQSYQCPACCGNGIVWNDLNLSDVPDRTAGESTFVRY